MTTFGIADSTSSGRSTDALSTYFGPKSRRITGERSATTTASGTTIFPLCASVRSANS